MTEPMSGERMACIRRSTNDGAISIGMQRDLLAEVDRLRAWKTEAMVVHAEWDETWIAAGRPGRLGGSKAVGVRQEIERLRAVEARRARVTEEIDGYRDSLDDHVTMDDFDRALATLRAGAEHEVGR